MTNDGRGRFEEQAARFVDCDGVSMCVDCGLLFEPRAKHSAKRCELCNRSATAPSLWQHRDHPDGRGFSVGLISGIMHFRTCAACGEEFPAGTAATLYCESACKRAGARGETRQHPGTIGWTPEYRAAVKQALERDSRDKFAKAQAALRAAHGGQPLVTSAAQTAALIAEVKAQRQR